MKRSHTITVRISKADYQRLLNMEIPGEVTFADRLRFLISAGLKVYGSLPLVPLQAPGRPKEMP